MACWFVHLYRVREHLFRSVGLVGGQGMAFSDPRILKIISLVVTHASSSAPHRLRGDGQTGEIKYTIHVSTHISLP